MQEIFGIDLAVVTAFALIVMMIVNAIKKDKPNLPNWSIRVIAVAISFAVVILTWLGSVEFNWIMYLKTSIATGLLSSGIWDATTQIGLKAIDRISSAKVNIDTTKDGASSIDVTITKDEDIK